MIAPLTAVAGRDARVLVGPETADDAGVYLLDGHALVATADFIMPVCDDPHRFGRVAAANSLSDVYAMGGRPLFALNLCCFPDDVPAEALAAILFGAADAMREAGAALLGGHSVRDRELKFGLAVIGQADRGRLITNANARPGERLILTKPLGTGVLVNAYKKDKIDERTLEPALQSMERLNADASRLAVEHGVRGGTDITGFGLAGHALGIARASGVILRVAFGRLPVLDGFYLLVKAGITTGGTKANEKYCGDDVVIAAGLDKLQRELVFDPQTSGGLLLSVSRDRAESLLSALGNGGHTAADIGEVVSGPPRVEIA